MNIDLDELERIARAADKDNPGLCFYADHVDGYPSVQSAMDHFNAMDPATAMSLIRRHRRTGRLRSVLTESTDPPLPATLYG